MTNNSLTTTTTLNSKTEETKMNQKTPFQIRAEIAARRGNRNTDRIRGNWTITTNEERAEFDALTVEIRNTLKVRPFKLAGYPDVAYMVESCMFRFLILKEKDGSYTNWGYVAYNGSNDWQDDNSAQYCLLTRRDCLDAIARIVAGNRLSTMYQNKQQKAVADAKEELAEIYQKAERINNEMTRDFPTTERAKRVLDHLHSIQIWNTCAHEIGRIWKLDDLLANVGRARRALDQIRAEHNAANFEHAQQRAEKEERDEVMQIIEGEKTRAFSLAAEILNDRTNGAILDDEQVREILGRVREAYQTVEMGSPSIDDLTAAQQAISDAVSALQAVQAGQPVPTEADEVEMLRDECHQLARTARMLRKAFTERTVAHSMIVHSENVKHLDRSGFLALRSVDRLAESIDTAGAMALQDMREGLMMERDVLAHAAAYQECWLSAEANTVQQGVTRYTDITCYPDVRVEPLHFVRVSYGSKGYSLRRRISPAIADELTIAERLDAVGVYDLIAASGALVALALDA